MAHTPLQIKEGQKNIRNFKQHKFSVKMGQSKIPEYFEEKAKDPKTGKLDWTRKGEGTSHNQISVIKRRILFRTPNLGIAFNRRPNNHQDLLRRTPSKGKVIKTLSTPRYVSKPSKHPDYPESPSLSDKLESSYFIG